MVTAMYNKYFYLVYQGKKSVPLLLGSQFSTNFFFFKPIFDLWLSVLFTVACTVKCSFCITSESQGGLVRVPAGFVVGTVQHSLI